MIEFLLYLFSFTVFAIYVPYVIKKYGVLESISDSYYRTNNTPLFTVFIWTFSIPIMIAATTPLVFLAGASIAAVGAAAPFKDKIIELIHFGGAGLGVVLGLIHIAVSYNLWYVSVCFLAAAVAVVWFKLIPHRIWWVEVAAFLLIIGSLLIDSATKLFF